MGALLDRCLLVAVLLKHLLFGTLIIKNSNIILGGILCQILQKQT